MESVQIANQAVESQRFMTRVYGWMSLALVVTAVVAAQVVSSPAALHAILGQRWVFYSLLIGELGLVIWLSRALPRLAVGQAIGLFLLYAALNGVTLSVVLLVYTRASVMTTFACTAGMFACMSVIGATTAMDLTAIGALCMMGLIGLILATIANWFLQSTGLQSLVTYLGVAVFVGLTAYDTQKLRALGLTFGAGTDDEKRGAIYGALELYLDFVNLFLYVLRLVGRRR